MVRTRTHAVVQHTHEAHTRRVAGTEHVCAQPCGHRNAPTRARQPTARCARGRTPAHLAPAGVASAQHLLSTADSSAPSLGTLGMPEAPQGGAVAPTSHAGWDLHTGHSFSLRPLPPADQPVLDQPTRLQNLQVLRHASRAPRKASWRRRLQC